jgi:subtilisin family serine protease
MRFSQLVAAVVVAFLAMVSVASGQGSSTQSPRPADKSSTVPLASGALRDTVARVRAGEAAPDGVVGGKVRVEILHGAGPAAIRQLVGSLGGTNLRPAGAGVVEALVPLERLVELEGTPEVSFVRPPLSAALPISQPVSAARARTGEARAAVAPVLGEEVTKTNAANWHAAGHRGKDVKFGIIDSFSAQHWNDAARAGEVPTPAGLFCQMNGQACPGGFWGVPGGPHGVAVAEIIREMAPGAQLYLAQVSGSGDSSAADLQAAVNYFAGQGVRIVTRSLAAEYDGPGNGTGSIDSVIDNAVARGMVWFNSAGNSAGAGIDPGEYWRGTWFDPNGNRWLDFAPGDELLGFNCSYTHGVRWSDWGASRTDYDVYVLDEPNSPAYEAWSEDDQGAGAPPLEHLLADRGQTRRGLRCNGDNDTDYLKVWLYAPGSGTAGDVIEFMNNGRGNERWQNPYSAGQPASDSASPGALSVGAIDPPLGLAIAGYSAQGPMNDLRGKPDLSAPACLKSYAYRPGCFNGTSAATPVAAGAAALVLGANPTWAPVAVRSYLVTQAVVDRGTPGADNIFGTGELRLPTLRGIRDVRRPTVRALAASGRRGSLVRLRYRVSDNSGRTRDRIQVFRRSRRVSTFRFKLGRTGAFSVRWRAPSSGVGFRFCVRAWDATGNASRPSCARIRLRG